MFKLAQRNLKAQLTLGLVSVLLCLLLTACSFSLGPTPPPAANTAAQLPNLTGKAYNQYEGADVLKAGKDASGLLAFFKSQPQVAATLTVVSTLGDCADKQGIANWRIYVKQQDPSAAGIVLVVSQARLTNPTVIINCITGNSQVAGSNPPDISPCSDNYTYKSSSDTYLIFYAATKREVCSDFVAALPKN